MKNTIEEYGIKLNFHLFDSPFFFSKEKLLFTFLKNREKDLEKAGISKLYSLLSTKYDNVGHGVSTTLVHKIVFDRIALISNRKVIVPKENERAPIKKPTNRNPFKTSFSDFSNFSDYEKPLSTSGNNKEREGGEGGEMKEEEPFIEVSDLLQSLNEKNDYKKYFERKEIEIILEDLHKLGLIVYFKKKSLSDTIISNPQWFNNVFKSILDFGRKKVEIIFQSIYNKLKETNNVKMKEKLRKRIQKLKGEANQEKQVHEIWNNKNELKKSNLDKVSFETLLNKLEKYVEKLIEENEHSVFDIEQLQDFSFSSISQKFIFISEDLLVSEVINKVLEESRLKGDIVYKPKKEFLLNILSQFDFMIPTKRLSYKIDGRIIRRERTFVVPLLFPSFKPSSSSLRSIIKNLSKKNENQEKFKAEEWKSFENEWIVDYYLPFKPSTVWKLLFMRIRGSCVGVNESEREMQEEMYWLNGFSFYLVENDPTKVKTFVELEIEEENELGQVVMKITIKSNLNDLNFFYSTLHLTIQAFVKEWIISDIYNRIYIKITKKLENKDVNCIQQFFKISENLQFNDSIEQYFSNKNNEKAQHAENFEIDKFKCFNCGFTLSLIDLKDNTCDKCSFNFFYFSFYFFFNFLIFYFFYFYFYFYFLIFFLFFIFYFFFIFFIFIFYL